MLLQAIMHMFKNKAYNRHNAQLIFSAHDTSILEDELLRISEVTFVENSVENGTTAHRLCDFDGISNFDNFRKMYMNYQFGGVPYSHT
jgi:AAA15 family ATPase/GTPase